LRKRLYFSFSIVSNLSRPGSRSIRPLDRFRVKVWVRNDSGLALKRIRGAVRSTLIAEFSEISFDMPALAVGEQREIAELEMVLLETRANPFVFDRVATVSVAAQADLSDFCFREASRPLTYVHEASAPGAIAPALQRIPSHASTPRRRPKVTALALSPVGSDS
jgi:hypothetical protein